MQDIQLLWGIAKKRSGDGPRQLEMPHISHHWEVGKIIDSKVPGPLGDMLMFLEGFFPYHDMYYTYIYIYLQIVNSISSRIHLICFWLLSWRGFWWICVSMFLFFFQWNSKSLYSSIGGCQSHIFLTQLPVHADVSGVGAPNAVHQILHDQRGEGFRLLGFI